MIKESLVTVFAPTFEHHHSGLGIQESTPRISWSFSCGNSKIRDWLQTSYELEIKNDSNNIQTYNAQSSQSSLLPWPPTFPPLRSRERRYVRTRCVGTYSLADETFTETTPWSAWSAVQAALLYRSDWHNAQMVTISKPLPLNTDGSFKPLAFLKPFSLPKGAIVRKARLYATSHGVYYATLNGKPVGNECMSPGWQSYQHRLHYQVYEVSSLIRTGVSNQLRFDVGPGWFASALTSHNYRGYYGDEPGVLAQLEVEYRLKDESSGGEGETLVICTDDSWRCGMSSIVSSEIYNGEVFDQRREEEIVKTVSRILSLETTVSSTKVAQLISPETPPVRVTQTVLPKAILTSPSGKTILDFGQNLVGRLRVQNVLKPSGHRVTFRHAEVLEDGELCVRPLREAKQTDTIICSGSLLLDWTPKFTFHGFRYVEVTGWDPSEFSNSGPENNINTISAQVMHTDMPITGTFSCSNEELNRLHSNAVWSLRGNFLSVPTDCPARDDREGWTGDLAIFIPVATFLYNTTGMLIDWLANLSADQFSTSQTWSSGVVPLVVPNCFERRPQQAGQGGWDPLPQGIWSDAAILIPWALYTSTHDLGILRRQYPSMTAYLSSHGGGGGTIIRGPDGLWDPSHWQFGDWLDPTAPVNNSSLTRTDATFVADCFLLRSTRLMSRIASLLDERNDAAHYRQQYRSLLKAFHHKYLTPSHLLLPDTPTALALAIHFRLLPSATATAICAARLRRHLQLVDFRIPTGFAGTASLLHALGMTGQVDCAFTMLESKARPGILWAVRNGGATTVWERWDALEVVEETDEDEVGGGRGKRTRVNEGSMTSFNHYALGAVVGWLERGVGGLMGWDGDGDGNDDANADHDHVDLADEDPNANQNEVVEEEKQGSNKTLDSYDDGGGRNTDEEAEVIHASEHEQDLGTTTKVVEHHHHHHDSSSSTPPSPNTPKTGHKHNHTLLPSSPSASPPPSDPSHPVPPPSLPPFLIAPHIHHALTHAHAQHLTPCGWVSCRWEFVPVPIPVPVPVPVFVPARTHVASRTEAAAGDDGGDSGSGDGADGADGAEQQQQQQQQQRRQHTLSSPPLTSPAKSMEIEVKAGERYIVNVEVVVPPNMRARFRLRGVVREDWLHVTAASGGAGAGEEGEDEGGTSEYGLGEDEDEDEDEDEVGNNRKDFDQVLGSGKYVFECVYDVDKDGGEYPVPPLLPPWGRAEF